jgi:hypothetical protein
MRRHAAVHVQHRLLRYALTHTVPVERRFAIDIEYATGKILIDGD